MNSDTGAPDRVSGRCLGRPARVLYTARRKLSDNSWRGGWAMRAAIWQGPGRDDPRRRARRHLPARRRAAARCSPAASAAPTCARSSTATAGSRRRGCSATRSPGEILELGPRGAGRGGPAGRATSCTASRRCTAATAACAAPGTSTSACNGELMGFDYAGAYAELVAIPAIAMKNLFRVPEGLPADPLDLRRPAVRRDLRPQGPPRRARPDRRRHRRGPGRHGALRAGAGPGRRRRCCCWSTPRTG